MTRIPDGSVNPVDGAVPRVESRCGRLGHPAEAKTLVKSLGNLVIPFRIKTANRGGQNQLILSLLWTNFLSSEIADYFKVALWTSSPLISTEITVPSFRCNNRVNASASQSEFVRGVAGGGPFLGNIGVPHMKLEQFSLVHPVSQAFEFTIRKYRLDLTPQRRPKPPPSRVDTDVHFLEAPLPLACAR